MFQWNDPSIDEFVRFDMLTAEVVEQKDSAVGLYVERRFIEAARVAVPQVQSFEGQLTTHDDERPGNPYPSSVELRCVGGRIVHRNPLVTLRIEDPDDVTAYAYAIRDPQVTAQGLVQRASQTRLAVTGGAKNEQTSPRRDRQTCDLSDVLRQYHIRDCRSHVLGGYLGEPGNLQLQHSLICFKRHWRRSDVTGDLH